LTKLNPANPPAGGARFRFINDDEQRKCKVQDHARVVCRFPGTRHYARR